MNAHRTLDHLDPSFPSHIPSTRPGSEKLEPPMRWPWLHDANDKATGKLKGLVALITGGDSQIGRSVAVRFAQEGAHVALTHFLPVSTDAIETVEAIRAEGKQAVAIQCNVGDPQACRNTVKQVIDRFERLDTLVNNEAFQKHRDRIDYVTVEQWEYTFQVNIHGYFYMVKAALAHMSGGATIINTGSITGLIGNKELLDYWATKGAIHAFTKSLAQHLANRNIRVNCVAPGPVWTPLTPAASRQSRSDLGQDTAIGRPAQPEEIAPAYVFFASNADSQYITGEVLTLLGGETTAG